MAPYDDAKVRLIQSQLKFCV